MTSEWQKFFQVVASNYDEEVFTRDTKNEVNFLVKELDLKAGASILDIGCGTGRHSIELAKRGYKITGVDFSSAMLNEARRKAKEAELEINFIESSAQDFIPEQKYDAVISLCEGALCLFNESDNIWAKDMAIFANMAEALEPGSPFLVTVLNAFRIIRESTDEDVESGKLDLFTLTTREEFATTTDKELAISGKGIERYYTPSELVRMVNRIGLKVDKVYGGTAGNWKGDRLKLDEMEIMVVGHRKDHKGRSSK
jgi:SAM-dependent methyltransferase